MALEKSRGAPAMMQLAALVTGTCAEGKVKPIIGPPMMYSSVPGKAPPAASSSVVTGVPSGTSKLPGAATLPVTVTTRDSMGSPWTK